MKINHLLSGAKAFLLIKIFKAHIPLFVSWQITTRCNLRCKYCDYWKGSQSDELGTDSIFHIISELKKLGTIGISFTGGEPLIRDDIGKIISYAKLKGISSKINTNGFLVPYKISEIKDVEQVNLSFDGPEPVHDQIRGIDSYKATIKAVEALKKDKKRIVFHVVLSKYNLSSVEAILDELRKLEIGAFFQPATELFLLKKDLNPHSPDKRDYDKAVNLLIQEKRNRNRYIYNSISGLKHLSYWPGPKSIYCSAGKIIFRINSRGEFYHCERFPDANKFNCIKKGVKAALQKANLLSCSQCWCGPLVELNLAMDGKLDAVINAFKL